MDGGKLIKEIKEMYVVTIKTPYVETSTTKELYTLDELLEVIEYCIRASGFCFKGNLVIKEEDE